jgi:hypothetical protein
MRYRTGRKRLRKTDYLPAINKKTKSGVASKTFPIRFFFLHGVHYDRKVAFTMSNQNDIPVVRCVGGTHAKSLSLSI